MICEAARQLKEGCNIVFPTETVYGLGAAVFCDEAVLRLYSLKDRSLNKAMALHVGDVSQVEFFAKNILPVFYKLTQRYWPGPLTIVLQKKEGVSSAFSQDESVAVRCPDHPLFTDLIKELGQPIVGTSANLSGAAPCLDAHSASLAFPSLFVLDGGPCLLKQASTVISLLELEPRILREGALPSSEILSFLQK